MRHHGRETRTTFQIYNKPRYYSHTARKLHRDLPGLCIETFQRFLPRARLKFLNYRQRSTLPPHVNNLSSYVSVFTVRKIQFQDEKDALEITFFAVAFRFFEM